MTIQRSAERVALVTGANHGIGAATARALAAQGVAVLVNYLRLPAPTTDVAGEASTPGEAFYYQRRLSSGEEVAEQIRAQGGRAKAIEADLAHPATIPLLFDRAEELFGSVDILVNNADHCIQDTFLPPSVAVRAPDGFQSQTFSTSLHDAHFAINSRAVALLISEFARRHIEQGKHWGRIINLSTDGARSFPGEISYGASKAALESYSRAAASELGPYGITVNIISPGPIQTGWITSEMEQEITASTPLRRVGEPEDVADVIAFLASEQARWLTGQTLSVSGGQRMT